MRNFLLLTTALLLAAATGCTDVYFDHPVVPLDRAESIDGMVGIWAFTAEEKPNQRMIAHVGPAGEGFPEGLMRMLLVAFDPSEEPECQDLLSFLVKVDDTHYLQLLRLDPDGTEAEGDQPAPMKTWQPERVNAYRLLRVEIEDNTVHCRGLSSGAVQVSVEADQLEGKLIHTEPKSRHVRAVHVTASSSDIREWLSDPDQADSRWNDFEFDFHRVEL